MQQAPVEKALVAGCRAWQETVQQAPAWPEPSLSPPAGFDGDGILALVALSGSSPTGASGPPALGGSTVMLQVSVHSMAVRLRPHHE